LSAACCWEGPFCIWEGSRNKIAVGPKQSNQVFKTCAKTRKKAGLFLCCFLFFVLYPKPFFTEVIGLCSLLFLTMKVCCCSWWCFGFAEFCLLPNQGNNGWPGTKDEARGSRRVVGLIIWLFAGTKDTGTLANGQKTRNTHTQFLAVPQNALCTRTLPHVSKFETAMTVGYCFDSWHSGAACVEIQNCYYLQDHSLLACSFKIT
jgi:hypothetical protein